MRIISSVIIFIVQVTILFGQTNVQTYFGKESFLASSDNELASNMTNTTTEKELIPVEVSKTISESEKAETKPIETPVVHTAKIERTIVKKGIAVWTDNPSAENFHNLYALHKYAPIGTVIKLKNPMNGRITYVKVVGKLPVQQEYKNVVMLVSAATARQLHVLDEKFIIEQLIPASGFH